MTAQSAIYPSLEDRVVFITGGGSGIGASLTRSFAAQGSRVAFVDIAEDDSRRLVDDVERETGRRPLFLPCDIRDIPALQQAIVTTGDRLGRIGALMNNAASDDRHRFEDVTLEYWNNRIAINQRPMFFAAQAVAPHMRALGGGSIVNFGSISWRNGTPDVTIYASTKAAAHGLSRSLARDLGGDGVRVNTLIPGWVMTDKQRRLRVTPEADAQIDREQLLKTRVQPEHIAAMALFLAADDSALCTAQEFVVDGGWT